MFSKSDIDNFLTVYDSSFYSNNGGMAAPDMFTLYYMLKTLKPTVVIESGVWNGLSTKLIRKTIGPDATIICLDPREVPTHGYKDDNTNTIYYTGTKFIDFEKLDTSVYDPNKTLVFFDCHQNAAVRLLQSNSKKLIHLFFNDNYPAGCGSHYTLEHLRSGDTRNDIVNNAEKIKIQHMMKQYVIFPNIFPGKIKTGEGNFDCESFFTSSELTDPKYAIFVNDQSKYRWNTYVELLF
jgi:hypothetical protein